MFQPIANNLPQNHLILTGSKAELNPGIKTVDFPVLFMVYSLWLADA